jgi:hypothetical protein
MSATPYPQKNIASDVPDARAGAVALVLLRLTLMGCVVALFITLGSVAWKIAGH